MAAVKKKNFAEWTQKRPKYRSKEISCQERERGAVTWGRGRVGL